MARPTKTRQLLNQAGELPQSDAVWECSVRKSPSWVEQRTGGVYRPAMIIVADASSGAIRFYDLPKGQPSADSVAVGLLKAMVEPASAGPIPVDIPMRAERPARVKFDWHSRVEDVQKALGEIGVAVEPAQDLPACDELYQSLLDYMNPGPRPPAICRVAPESPALTREFFEAADTFYRAEAWQYVFNDDIIEVRYGDEPPRYCSIMGNGGQEFGIVLYNSQEDVVNVLSSGHPLEMRRGMIWLTTSFDEAFVGAIEDIDYMEKHGIQPADIMAYPMFLRVRMPAGVESPDALDMKISAAALRVLPQFVVASMMAGEGEPQSATATLSLPAVHEGQTLTLSYPVAGLDEQIQQAEDAHDDASFENGMINIFKNLDPDDDDDDEFADDDALMQQADAMEAEMIEMAEELEPGAGRLLQAINTVQPAVSFKAEKDVLDQIKPKPKGMKAGVFYQSFSTLYADPRIGIMVAFVLPKSDLPVIIPLSLLDVDPSHPLADAILRYQQSRVG
jgi:hypothetical protein